MGAGTRRAAAERALAIVRELADDIGPRRPGGPREAAAADHVCALLAEAGARREPFRGPSTFAWVPATPPLLALLGRPGRGGVRDRLLAAAAAALALAETNPRRQPLTRLVGRMPSANVTAAVEPRGEFERTLCLVSHLDSSRSGLLFHPRLAPHLRTVIGLSSAVLLIRCAALVAGGIRGARAVGRATAPALAAGLALLAERELRGEDVPGANDNASGVAVAATVFAELVERPPETTRVVFLATGCEESGTVGMRSFLDLHDTRGWLFLNLDGVGAAATLRYLPRAPPTLRYLPREGVGRTWAADPGLVAAARDLAARRPDLGLAPAERLVGLTYDATPVLAGGGRALTLSAQDETIPNYHTAADIPENLDPDVVDRALEVVRELVAAIERGDADPR